MNVTDAIGKLARWRLRLYELEDDAEYWAGMQIEAAGALSWFATTVTDKTTKEDEIP